jgi:hypothetical protein
MPPGECCLSPTGRKPKRLPRVRPRVDFDTPSPRPGVTSRSINGHHDCCFAKEQESLRTTVSTGLAPGIARPEANLGSPVVATESELRCQRGRRFEGGGIAPRDRCSEPQAHVGRWQALFHGLTAGGLGDPGDAFGLRGRVYAAKPMANG